MEKAVEKASRCSICGESTDAEKLVCDHCAGKQKKRTYEVKVTITGWMTVQANSATEAERAADRAHEMEGDQALQWQEVTYEAK